VSCPESATDVGSQLPVAVRPVVGPGLRPGSVRKVQHGWAAPRALMPGIQITVSPALMGSSHLVQVVSVETVQYTRAPSRDQPFRLNGLTAADSSRAPLRRLRHGHVFVVNHRL
jgi:hypothetical protein